MKKIMFGAILALGLAACGEATVDEVVEPTVNTEAVMEMETATEEVTEGMEEMEAEVETLGEDIDELLNDI